MARDHSSFLGRKHRHIHKRRADQADHLQQKGRSTGVIRGGKKEADEIRTRNKKLEDYGVYPEDEDVLKRKCIEATRDERHELLHCCINAAPEGLEVLLYESLACGKSYDQISKNKYIPIKKDDFYGYRRKAMALFYDFLRMRKKV